VKREATQKNVHETKLRAACKKISAFWLR